MHLYRKIKQYWAVLLNIKIIDTFELRELLQYKASGVILSLGNYNLYKNLANHILKKNNLLIIDASSEAIRIAKERNPSCIFYDNSLHSVYENTVK